MSAKKQTESPGCSPNGDSVIDVPPKFTQPRDQAQCVPGNSTASQGARVLHRLQTVGSLTALQALHELDVLRLAARIKELRTKGYQIETLWVDDMTPEGNLHRVGQYVLTPSEQLTLPGMSSRTKEACNDHFQ